MSTKLAWVGSSLASLPGEDLRKLETHCTDHARDISVLTNPNVKIAVFHLDDTVKELFDIACKICTNLGKSLIVVVSPSYNLAPYTNETRCRFVLPAPGNSIYQQLLCTLETMPPYSNSVVSHSSNRLNKIDVFIDQNIDRDIREEEVANLANFSTTYFSKFFRKHKNISFQEYLSNKRMELSKQLLVKQPREKVSTIAFQVGYSDVSYFNRVFKKHTSLTPTEYRSTSSQSE